MNKILQHSRRPDISFCRSGRIYISSRIVKFLDIRRGDSINIAFNEGECLLYVSGRGNAYRNVAQCFPTKTGSKHFCANSVALARGLLDIIGIKAKAVKFFVGEPMSIANTTYLPIIYKQPIYD